VIEADLSVPVIVLAQSDCTTPRTHPYGNSAVLAMNLAHVGDLGVDHVRETGQASKSVLSPAA
jgi:hypothetical protein